MDRFDLEVLHLVVELLSVVVVLFVVLDGELLGYAKVKTGGQIKEISKHEEIIGTIKTNQR